MSRAVMFAGLGISMKSIIKSKGIHFIGWLFNVVNMLIPKTENKCVISSFPDFDDMTRGLLPFLENQKVVILYNSYRAKKPRWLSSNVVIYRKYSAIGVWHLMTTGTIYYTHGIFVFFRKLSVSRQKVVNMWHGMPLKNIGLLDGKSQVADSHYVYCTSIFFQKIMADAFGKNIKDVLVVGLPRNNILTKPVVNLTLIGMKKQYDKIFVWLPTYRRTKVGDVRIDGDSNTVYGFDDFDANQLNEILASKNYLVIIKPHPLAVLEKSSPSYSNIKHIDESWLFEYGLTLYELLGGADMLWTDFSSVFVDYLVVNRKILFLMHDFDSYKNNRGFTFDPSELRLLGEVVTNEDDLFYIIKSNFSMVKKIEKNKFNTVPLFKI